MARPATLWQTALACLAAAGAAAASLAFAPPALAEPVASFSYSPKEPRAGEVIAFSSTSSDPDGVVADYEWDTDGDFVYGDGSGPTATRLFDLSEAGPHEVGLRLLDAGGAELGVHREVVNVQIPVSFSFFPPTPLPGQEVLFFVPAPPAEVTYAWDLDGDGSFERDTGTGTFTYGSFPAAGSHLVRLRVTRGPAFGDAAVTVLVALPGQPLTPAAGAARLLSPFPVVRIAGRVTRRGTRIRRLTVSAPSGSLVKLRCRGRGCPARESSRTAHRSAERGAIAAALVRMRPLEGRLLRPGATVEVRVTKGGAIGKFTRFKVRRRKPPTRTDLCLVPGSSAPLHCPSG